MYPKLASLLTEAEIYPLLRPILQRGRSSGGLGVAIAFNRIVYLSLPTKVTAESPQVRLATG